MVKALALLVLFVFTREQIRQIKFTDLLEILNSELLNEGMGEVTLLQEHPDHCDIIVIVLNLV